jgi:tRNA threonylcarbamoyladenosine biosynthesis protein TsaB
MLILSLDTTTRTGSAAVLRDDTVLAVIEGEGQRTHGERLPAELHAVLRAAGVDLTEIDLLAVARGPGAFTGLRIGLAAMQGIALVTGRPVVGISALDALAAATYASLGVAEARIGVWMDAARGEVFAAAYEASGEPAAVPRLTGISSAQVGDPAAIWQEWLRLSSKGWTMSGDGATRYLGHLTNAQVVPAPLLAPAIARLAVRLPVDTPRTPDALEPLYVRRPDAERGRP